MRPGMRCSRCTSSGRSTSLSAWPWSVPFLVVIGEELIFKILPYLVAHVAHDPRHGRTAVLEIRRRDLTGLCHTGEEVTKPCKFRPHPLSRFVPQEKSLEVGE